MKKILIIIVVLALAYNHFNKTTSNNEEIYSESETTKSIPEGYIVDHFEERPYDAKNTTTPSSSKFKCDGRQHCSQMTSREEAEFFNDNCPNTKMDGDGDGIPCESDTRF